MHLSAEICTGMNGSMKAFTNPCCCRCSEGPIVYFNNILRRSTKSKGCYCKLTGFDVMSLLPGHAARRSLETDSMMILIASIISRRVHTLVSDQPVHFLETLCLPFA